jgi:2-keto-myo-inositol isomerase
MTPCVSELTTMPAAFDEDVRAFADAACSTMEVWFTKLEQFVGRYSVAKVREVVQEYGVRLAVASAQGGILVTQGEQRREGFSLFDRRLKLCQSLQIPTLVVLADFTHFDAADYSRAVVSLRQAARMAADHSVRLALEFQGRAGFCNNLNTALAMLDELDQSNAGICFDVFHYYTGPSKFEDLNVLTSANLFHVQLSDLAGVPRELATDADRILPGDGDFQLQPIFDRLRAIGYQDCVSVELMNPQIWQVPAVQVAEVSITALRKLLSVGQAASLPRSS